MQSDHGFKLLVAMAITLVMLAAQCSSEPTGPVSRAAPFSMSITLPTSAGSPLVSSTVLSTQNYFVSLEADSSNRCAITVRHKYSNPIGHLLWTANYFAGTPPGCTKCTLAFTKTGDLQLVIQYRGRSILTWHSNTAGKGIAKMALENVLDSGDFQLLTSSNQVVYRSFDVKEFAILPTQKLRPGETLKSPDAFYGTNQLPTVLFQRGDYILALQNGDLQLRTSGAASQVYWSLKRTLFKAGDLSKVAYAAVVPLKGGIGLFTAAGKLVWTSGSLPPAVSNPHDTYFGIDVFGNLKNYGLVKGSFWGVNFQAISSDCDLPNFCGDYGLCSKSNCSCPSGFTKTASRDGVPRCVRLGNAAKCARKSYLALSGYDSVFNDYAAPLKVSLQACKASCAESCDCDGLFYDTRTGSCHKTAGFKTLRKVASAHKLVFIKVQ